MMTKYIQVLYSIQKVEKMIMMSKDKKNMKNYKRGKKLIFIYSVQMEIYYKIPLEKILKVLNITKVILLCQILKLIVDKNLK